MTKTVVFAAALAAALGSVAFAHPGADKERGPITKEEMLERAQARFEKNDANGDGFLTVEEIEAAGEGRRARRASRMFERLDANEDGFLSFEETLVQAEERFDRADADGDGVLTLEERKAAQDKRGKRGSRGRN